MPTLDFMRDEGKAVIYDARRNPPAQGTALIGVAALALPEWLIEIEAIVVVDA
jgi:enamine deaminase RidA (YjgF/YER057c/UK114 family)